MPDEVMPDARRDPRHALRDCLDCSQPIEPLQSYTHHGSDPLCQSCYLKREHPYGADPGAREPGGQEHDSASAADGDGAAAAPPRPDGQPEAVEPQHRTEYQVAVIIPCGCGKKIVLPIAKAVGDALMGATLRAQCGACNAVVEARPAEESARLGMQRPAPKRSPNRHERRQMQKGIVPPGFARTAGGIIVPK